MSNKPLIPLVDIHQNKPLKRAEDAAREDKLQRALGDWKATFNAINDRICLLDRDGTILQCNESMNKLLNLPEGQIVGRKCYELMHGSSTFFQDCPYQEMLRTRKREGFELTLDDKCYMVTADPIFGEAGEITGAVHIIRDITHRKRAEEAYRIDEKRLRSVLKITRHQPESLRDLLDGALDEAIALSDSKLGYIYYYSEEKREFTLHAWSREVMKQCSIPNPPTVFQLEKTGLWGEAVRQRQPIVVNDFLAPHPLKKGYPEGHSPLFRYMTLPVFNKGDVVAVVAVANKGTDYTDLDVRQLTLMMDSVWEIAERKQIEMALQKSEEKFSKAFRASPMVCAITSLKDRRFIEVNNAFEQVSGWRRDEAIGRSFEELRLPADSPAIERIDATLRAEKSIRNVEAVFHTKTGELRIGLLSAELLEFQGELCALVLIEDITDRRKAEASVRQLAGKLLTAQEAERRRLAREMHDDFTQRLAVLAIEAGKLEQELDSSGTASGRLRDMKGQLIRLSEDVHALSRQLHPSILDDLGLVDALRSECNSFSQREGISVHCALEPAPANLPKDAALCLYRIAQEGLRNIARHAGVREASVSLASTSEGVLLSIEDAGLGFDPAQFHGKPGLGLASMEERARLIGGDFSIRSEPNQGTLIEVWAPLSESQP
jgi:PAS domain S-box-containing protein